MADATIVKTRPTNEYWQHCGPQKWDLSKQTEEARQSRIDWLKTLNRTPLPSGPYPFHVAFRGWFKGHIDDERYQACYVLREDLNLDVQIFKVTRSLDDGCVTNRVLIENPKTIIKVRLCKPELWAFFKASYPQEYKQLPATWEHGDVTAGSLQALIMREVELWREYDSETMEELKLMKETTGPAQCAAICNGETDTYRLRNAIIQDHQQQAAGRLMSSRAKRRLPFTGEGPQVPRKSKRPKVRVVSKLDKADAALHQVNKQVGNTLWLLGKLQDKKAFRKSLMKKPKKLAGAMFPLLPKKDLVTIAVHLAQHCAADSLEEVLQSYRQQASDVAQRKYNEQVQDSIVANRVARKVRKETELSQNAEDALPAYEYEPEEEEDEGPAGPTVEGPERKTDGPMWPEPKADGPVGPVGPEPKADEPVGPVGPEPEPAGETTPAMTTPASVAREHWITSSRSSTGYKGVILERKSGRFRIKHGGNTIARRDTLEEACSYYYNWCVTNGYIKDFRLV